MGMVEPGSLQQYAVRRVRNELVKMVGKRNQSAHSARLVYRARSLLSKSSWGLAGGTEFLDGSTRPDRSLQFSRRSPLSECALKTVESTHHLHSAFSARRFQAKVTDSRILSVHLAREQSLGLERRDAMANITARHRERVCQERWSYSGRLFEQNGRNHERLHEVQSRGPQESREMLVDPAEGAIDFADGTLLQVGINSHASSI
jgi:hypothetical protein